MTKRQRLDFRPGVLIALFALSACGGGNDGDNRVASLDSGAVASATAAAASTDLEKELTDYVECLRTQGVDLPDPSVDADGNISFGRLAAGQSFDRDKITQAQKVCGDLPEGLTAGLSGQDRTELQDIALKFAQCMREHDIDVPDPDLSQMGQGGGSGTGPFGDLDRDDPNVAAAIDVCQKVWIDSGITLRGGGS
jgi:hypothetical protein